MANWMYDYEEKTTERNERVYQLIMERKSKEAKQTQQQNIDNHSKTSIKCKNYIDTIQKLLWDDQNLTK